MTGTFEYAIDPFVVDTETDEYEYEMDPFYELEDEFDTLEQYERDDPFSGYEEEAGFDYDQLDEGEWLGEINSKSRDYVRWIQRSINQILGLRLKVDGVLGTQTRSAIRNFQRSKRLTVDGVVGPQTKRALLAAGAQTPPGQSTQTFPPDTIEAAAARLKGFDFDSAELKREEFHYKIINRVADKIVASWRSGKPIFTVKVVGHTDPEGPPMHNQKLGVRRALAVRKALQQALKIKQGDLYHKVLVLASSKGENEPIDSTNTVQGKALNRRVEVFLSTKALLPLPKKPPIRPKTEPVKSPPLLLPDTPYPHPPAPYEPVCDNYSYEILKNECINLTIRRVASCVLSFGGSEAEASAMGAVVIAMVIGVGKVAGVTPAFILGIIASYPVVKKQWNGRWKLANCIYNEVKRIELCYSDARAKTNCSK